MAQKIPPEILEKIDNSLSWLKSFGQQQEQIPLPRQDPRWQPDPMTITGSSAPPPKSDEQLIREGLLPPGAKTDLGYWDIGHIPPTQYIMTEAHSPGPDIWGRAQLLPDVGNYYASHFNPAAWDAMVAKWPEGSGGIEHRENDPPFNPPGSLVPQ